MKRTSSKNEYKFILIDKEGLTVGLADFIGIINPCWANLPPDLVASKGPPITVKGHPITVKSLKLTANDEENTVDIAVASDELKKKWSFTEALNCVVKDLEVGLSVSTSTKKPPSGFIKGNIVIGDQTEDPTEDSATIPLRVELSNNWSTFTFSVDTTKTSGEVALPSIGQIFSLVDSHWSDILPDALRNNRDIIIEEFKLKVEQPSARTFSAKLVTKDDWSGWVVVPDWLTIKPVKVELHWKTDTKMPTGSIQGDAKILGCKTTLSATLPDLVLKGTLDTPNLTLAKLLSIVFDDSKAIIPDWLETVSQNIGLLKFSVIYKIKENQILHLSCILAKDLEIDKYNKLKTLSVDVYLKKDVEPRVCLTSIWTFSTDGSFGVKESVKVTGELCYPFDKFIPPGVIPFPFSPSSDNDKPAPPGDYVDMIKKLMEITRDLTAAVVIFVLVYKINNLKLAEALLQTVETEEAVKTMVELSPLVAAAA